MKKRFLAMVLAVLVTVNTISVPEVKAVENSDSESVENVVSEENEEVSEDDAEEIQNEETEETEAYTTNDQSYGIIIYNGNGNPEDFNDIGGGFLYNGQAQYCKVEVTDPDGNEVDPKDYDVTYTKDGEPVDAPVDVGTYVCTVTLKDYLEENRSSSLEVEMKPFDLSKRFKEFTDTEYKYVYTGQKCALEEDLQKNLADAYGALTDSKNYKLSYTYYYGEDSESCPVNTGSYGLRCTISGAEDSGNVIGSTKVDLWVTIDPFDLSAAKENQTLYAELKEDAPKITYTGSIIELKDYLDIGYVQDGVRYVFDKEDYDLRPDPFVSNAGVYDVSYTISAKSKNLTGTVEIDGSDSIEVLKRELSLEEIDVRFNNEDPTYNGQEQSAPDLDVRFKQDNRWKYLSKSDYSVSAETGTEPGTYKISILPKESGNYTWTGTLERTYSIQPIDLGVIQIYHLEYEDDYTGGEIDLAKAVKEEIAKYLPDESYQMTFYPTSGDTTGIDEKDLHITDAGEYEFNCVVTPGDNGHLKGERRFPVSLTVKPLNISKIADFIYVGPSLDDDNVSITYTGKSIDVSDYYKVGYMDMGEISLQSEDDLWGDGDWEDGDGELDIPILFDKDDYILTFNKKLVNAGTYEGFYTIRAKKGGNLVGTVKVKDTVIVWPKEISASDLTITLAKDDLKYTGKEQKAPAVKSVSYNGTLLSKKDYELAEAQNGKEIGTYTVSVKVKNGGNYTWEGNASTEYGIHKSAADFAVTVPKITYLDGELPITVYENKAAAKAAAKPLEEGKDYTEKWDSAGTGKLTLTLTGINSYSGTKKVTVKYQKYDLKKAFEDGRVEVNILSDTSYTGTAVKPWLSISLTHEKTGWKYNLKETDYTITYSNNVKVGSTATVTIKGKGNYTGTIKNAATFTVEKLDLNHVDVLPAEAEATKKPWKPAVTLMKNRQILKLKAGKDYTVSVMDDADTTKWGSYNIKVEAVEGSANCENSAVGELHIYEKSVSSLYVVVNDGQKVYADGQDKSKITDFIKVYPSKKSTEPLSSDDYKIFWSGDTVNAGTATAVIAGLNEYGGYKTVKVKILKAK